MPETVETSPPRSTRTGPETGYLNARGDVDDPLETSRAGLISAIISLVLGAIIGAVVADIATARPESTASAAPLVGAIVGFMVARAAGPDPVSVSRPPVPVSSRRKKLAVTLRAEGRLAKLRRRP